MRAIPSSINSFPSIAMTLTPESTARSSGLCGNGNHGGQTQHIRSGNSGTRAQGETGAGMLTA